MWKARVDRIRQEVRVQDILAQEGFDVRADAEDQQFRCHLHGTGQDQKPSAHLYGDTNSWYCWGCGKARDPVSTLRDARGITFREAVRYLERTFHLPPLPEQVIEPDTPLVFQQPETLDKAFHRIEVLLKSLREGRDTSWRYLAKMWWILDETRALPEDEARKMLGKIYTTVMTELKAQWSGLRDTPSV